MQLFNLNHVGRGIETTPRKYKGRCVVTGATGFLGGHLSRRLNSLGYEVIGLGRDDLKGFELEAEGIKFRQAKLESLTDIQSVIKEGDDVFHCGAMSTLWGKYEDFYRTNVLGTQNVVDVSLLHNARRMIHVSTPAIYFHFEDRLNVTEEDELPKVAVNNYAKTKRMAEEVVDEGYKTGLPVITIRPRGIFGIGDTAIFPRLLKANERAIPLINGGRALTDIVYVDNVVDAMLLCQNTSDKNLGEKYNISNDEPLPVRELVDKFLASLDITPRWIIMNQYVARGLCETLEFVANHITHREPALSRYSLGLFSKNETISIEKAKRELGYKPRISLDEGIGIFADYWKSHESQNI